jgi:hypothetical protein
MAKTNAQLTTDHSEQENNNLVIQSLIDNVQLRQGANDLPTSDPTEAGSLFITGSDGMNLGDITGSGFAVLCVSQG